MLTMYRRSSDNLLAQPSCGTSCQTVSPTEHHEKQPQRSDTLPSRSLGGTPPRAGEAEVRLLKQHSLMSSEESQGDCGGEDCAAAGQML